MCRQKAPRLSRSSIEFILRLAPELSDGVETFGELGLKYCREEVLAPHPLDQLERRDAQRRYRRTPAQFLVLTLLLSLVSTTSNYALTSTGISMRGPTPGRTTSIATMPIAVATPVAMNIAEYPYLADK